MSVIKKAVFPVAGLGTRFLPFTKASPKEMLPIVDKPLIQYAVEEALAAGVTELIFITGKNKRAIEDHFDKAFELEAELEARNKKDLLDAVRGILPAHASCVYIRQPETLGLGHAVLCARPAVGNNPFAVILPDDLMSAEPNVLKQMVDLYRQRPSSIVAVQTVAKKETGSYGIVEGEVAGERLYTLSGIVEKPNPNEAPSTLAVVGRYIFTPEIFSRLEKIRTGAGGEYQLTDGIADLMRDETVYAYEFIGQRHDCGGKLGYLQATVEYGLQHPELGSHFREFLKKLKV